MYVCGFIFFYLSIGAIVVLMDKWADLEVINVLF